MSAGWRTIEPRRQGWATEASINMPLEKRERKTDQPAGMPSVSRRSVIRAALASGLGAPFSAMYENTSAQHQAATPNAGQGGQSETGIALPEGITLASNATPASGTPVRGGALRLVR